MGELFLEKMLRFGREQHSTWGIIIQIVVQKCSY